MENIVLPVVTCIPAGLVVKKIIRHSPGKGGFRSRNSHRSAYLWYEGRKRGPQSVPGEAQTHLQGRIEERIFPGVADFTRHAGADKSNCKLTLRVRLEQTELDQMDEKERLEVYPPEFRTNMNLGTLFL